MVVNQLNDLESEGKLNFANKVLRDFLKIYSFGKFSHKKDCWGGKKEIIINSDGEVYPCISESYLSPRKFGNIKNERFKVILDRLNNFKCSMEPNSACWDHFLWDRLAKKLERDDN
jgi:MoaA/NifB/PqqE/SkfB family radical SAM enzyme